MLKSYMEQIQSLAFINAKEESKWVENEIIKLLPGWLVDTVKRSANPESLIPLIRHYSEALNIIIAKFPDGTINIVKNGEVMAAANFKPKIEINDNCDNITINWNRPKKGKE